MVDIIFIICKFGGISSGLLISGTFLGIALGKIKV
jgi:hypothetical protein